MNSKSECTIKKLKNIVHVSEAIIMEDKCDKKLKPYYPTIKDTVQISNKKYEKPLIPTINEVVLLDKQSIKHLKNNNKSVDIQKSDKKNNTTRARFFNEKRNSDLAERKRLAELRKIKLDQLQKTTKELAKASIKKKVTHVQDECKYTLIDINLPTELNQPDLDQTWSPPPRVFKSLKKTPKMSIPKKLIKDLEITCDDDMKNLSTFSKISKNSNTVQQNKLVEKKPQLREVTKPEHLFTKLKFDDYQLFDNSIFNISTSKKANIDISLVQNDHNNVKCIEEIEKLQEGNNVSLYKEMSDIYSSTQPIDSVTIDHETFTGIQSPNTSLSEIVVKSNDHLVECQELSIDQCLSSKKCYSESTQTDNHNNLLSSFSSKKSPTPMNFISVLKCKNNLQLSKQNNLNSSKSIVNLSVNEHSISNYTNNVEPNIVKCNNMLHQSNMNEETSNEDENGLNKYKCSLVDETIISKSKELSLNELSKNIVYENKTNIENNDKLFTKLNITNNDIKHILKKLNFDFDFENSNINTNDLPNTCVHLQFDDTSLIHRSPCFSEIHSEFQAEIDILDQMNDSLCDIEKMNCDIKTNKLSIDDDLNDQCISNDMNFKKIFNASHVNNDDVQTSFSKLSSNMVSVDKSIIGFSIQMFEQLIKDEELRAKQHYTILRLRENSLMNRLKWEVAMCDLHVKDFKNRPCYEKQLQLFKQKHRGSLKKIEHSLFQVKKLGRIIDSVYKKRLIMLEEHLLQLKMKSSSKKVIRKLKSLDQVPKKEEYACRSLSSNFLLQCDKTDVIVDTIESKQVKIDCTQSHLTSKNNNTLPTVCELNKSKITLQTDRATSPINIETKFNLVENVKVQTDFEGKISYNKSIQTSELFNHGHSKNIRPTDLSHKYELPHVYTIDDTLLPITPSHAKRKQISESSISTNSDQSDMEIRITTLQKQLEARKLESFRLKKEQKKLRLANLKAKEQDLLRQIDLYDKNIEESKKSIMVEVERKSNQVKMSSIEHDSSSKSSSCSIVKNITNYETDDNMSEEKCQFSNVSDRITWTDGKKYSCPTARKELSNQDKPPYQFEHKNAIKSKQNLNSFINNCDPVNAVNSKLTKEVCKVLSFYKEPIAIEVNTLKESHENQIEVNTFNGVENLNEKVLSNKKNEFIQGQEMLNTSNNQELYLENNTSIKNPAISCPNINHNFSNTSSSNSNIQKKLINFNKNDDSAVYVNKENGTSEFETLSIEIGVDDDYSADFISDDNTSIVQGSYDFNTNNDNSMIEFHDGEQNNESSYEEERSEGDIMFENKTFIEQYSDEGNLVQYDISTMNKVDAITNNIVNSLLKDTQKMFITNMSKNILKKSDSYILTEETPLLMNLEEEHNGHNAILLTEQATIISDELLKRHLQPFLSETFQLYLPKLDETQMEKLALYLKWSSNRKKLKLSKYFQHKTSDVKNDESFEIFYLKYQEQKKSSKCRDENNDVIMLNQKQQEAKKLKLEQMRIEEEIQRLRNSEKTQLFSKKIPNKPPPPYKSPTKKEALIDMPYTSDETRKIVLAASSQLFNDFNSSMSKDYILDSDSSLHINYKTLIFDYCKEIAQTTFVDNENIPVWKRPAKKLKHFRAKPKNPEDLCNVVMNKINKIVDIDECEEKVNKFVVKQLHDEGSKWTDFQMDEMDIQNDIVQSLMKKLVCDTITNIKTNFYLKFN